MSKRQKKPEGGASWMDTYGDMVTLLLCFFVMLYSMSSVDQVKWKNFVLSVNPKAENVSQVVTDTSIEPGEDPVEGYVDVNKDSNQGNDVKLDEQEKLDEEFDKLYVQLKQGIQENNLESQIEISKGDGYTFVVFRDKVFFDGDSSTLKPEGKRVLNSFCKVLKPARNSIKEIKILGHTSQGDPNIPNEVVTDRRLSADRSAEVVAYIQQRSIIEPSKLVSVAYGQFRPIATFKTTEGRARNRRVEMLITKTDSVEQSLDDFYNQVYKK